MTPITQVGFTGSREGMSKHQKAKFVDLARGIISRKGCIVFHHGDCLGADADAHNILTSHEFRLVVSVVIHPPLDPKYRAYCKGDIILDPIEYLERDRNIVDCTHFMIATPKSDKEERRSGTWYTIRYAKRNKKPVFQLLREKP